jgi:ketosteroid isomerase-like protein
MTRIAFASLNMALLVLTLSAQNQNNQPPYSREQQEVLAVDNAIQAAVLAGDVTALDRHWSDDVMFIGGDGRVWKKAERLKDFESQNRRVAAQHLDPPSLRVYGDTAILAVSGWQKGVRDGRAFNSRSYLTRVYLKRGGRWRMVHQQGTLLERTQ